MYLTKKRFDSLYDSLLRLNFTKYSNKNKNSTGDFIEFENFNCDHNPFVDKFKIVRKNTFNYREGIDKYESFFSNLLKGKRLFKKKLKLEDLNFKSIENENKGNTLKLIATDTKPYKSSKKGNIKARRFKLYNCILMTDNDVYYNSKINFQFF